MKVAASGAAPTTTALPSLATGSNRAAALPAFPDACACVEVSGCAVADAGPSGDVLRAAGVSRADIASVGRGDRVWFAQCGGSSFVLRRSRAELATWLHPILRQLAESFPVPVPLAMFAGQSFVSDRPYVWEALSRLPGHEIGFSERPSLRDVGAFLARFHQVSLEQSSTTSRRPAGIPLSRVAEAVDWDGALVTMGSAGEVTVLRGMVERFAADLGRIGYHDLATCVVHGDPTAFNVLADGSPLRPSGLIDFELADVEPPIADVAFGLWRSGRPRQDASDLDLQRVREFMTGYRSVRTVTDQELEALPLCLRGRGLQMLAKQSQRAIPDSSPAAQLRWIEEHAYELIETVAATA
jgi:Ser/Thr protein kinase RdoA (MazF antagonist)